MTAPWGVDLLGVLEAAAPLYQSERTLVVRGVSPAWGALVLKTTAEEQPSRAELERYRHEYRMLRRVEERGVVRALGLEERGGRPLLLLEDTGACALEGLLRERARSPAEVLAWLIQAADALARIHDAGVLHRDLSPSNLVWSPRDGALQIIDFGKSADAHAAPAAPPEEPAGTLAYLAPEQTGRVSHPIDERSDLYALGACFWHVLVGRAPFQADDPLGLIHAHLAQRPLPPERVRADAPAGLSAILLKLLAKDPADRYQSAAGLAADARRCAADPGAAFPLGREDRPARFVLPPGVFGREPEREALRAAFAAARAGRWAPALVVGPAGSGKTSLVAELASAAAAAGGRYGCGAFEPQPHGSPYQGWTAALRGLLRGILAGGEAEIARCRRRAAEILARVGRDRWTDALPELTALLGEPAPPASAPALGPEATRARLHAGVLGLLRALCEPERPMILVLEDLHGADRASLALLDAVVAAQGAPGLLLVATSRDEAAAPREMSRIELSPLEIGDIIAMVARCCRCPPEEAAPLAALLMGKTGGDPLLLRALLERLLRDGLVRPESGGGWRWEREAVADLDPGAGAARLLVEKLADLPEECRSALAAAALLGRRFDLPVLGAALADPDIAARLAPAAARWLVVPEDERGAAGGGWRFAHDQIRQHCASFLDPAARQAAQRALGLALAEATGDPAALFEAVGHLGGALALLSPPERLRLAELARAAGDRAWAAAAFDSAFLCYDTGARALGESGWEAQYPLALALATGACEAAQLTGRDEGRERHAAAVLARARSVADQAPAWLVRVERCMAQDRLAEAIEVSDAFLRLAGRPQIRRIDPFSLGWDLLRTWRLAGGRGPAELLELPEARDPLAIAIQRVQMAVAQAQFQLTPELLPRTILRDVRAVLQDGVTPWGAQCWLGLAKILIVGLRRVDTATRFGQLAVDQVLRLGRADLWPRMAFVHTFTVLPWSQVHRSLIEPLRRLVERAIAAGDMVNAVHAALVRDAMLFFTGAPLEQAAAALDESAGWLARHRTVLNAGLRAPLARAVRQLRGEAPLGWLEGGEMSPFEQTIERSMELLTALVFGVERVEIDWGVLETPFFRSPFITCFHYYFWTYAGVAALESQRRGRLPARRARWVVRRALRHGRQWGEHRPELRYRVTWILAQRQHLRGRRLAALRLYETALAGARAAGMIQDCAIIAEHAAQLCAESGLAHAGRALSREALGHYRAWGAAARVGELDDGAASPPQRSSSGGPYAIDLLSVVKASQAFSEELVYRRLLDRILETLLENTGATSGLVVLRAGEGSSVEARVAVEPGPEAALPCPLGGSGLGPEALIQFVIRTGEPVVLEDAARDDTWFAGAPRRPRSALCVPVGRGGATSGAIYLENELVAGCFTRDRLEVARLLVAQVSISLENALLVEGLEARVSQRTAELEEARRRAEGASAAKSAFLANMSHELRTPLNAILGYAQILQEKGGPDNPHRDGLRVIHRSGAHLLGLINDVLDMSRIEAGRLELEPAPTPLGPLLAGAVDVFGGSARQKGISLQLHPGEGLPRGAWVDARRVRQILLNLIGNAVKFTERGRIDVRASRAERGGAPWLRVAVEDTGPGVPAESLSAIFEPFEQAGSADRRAQGTGLGLAISRQLAALMGGDIRAESRADPPSGSTFYLEIPLVDAAESGPAGEEAAALYRPPAEEPIPGRDPLIAPDRAELEALLALVQSGNLGAVAARAQALPGHAAFAQRLLELTESFDDRGAEELLERLLAAAE